MIETVPLTTTQKIVVGFKKTTTGLKKQHEMREFKVPMFQYGTILFHLKLKIFPRLYVKK